MKKISILYALLVFLLLLIAYFSISFGSLKLGFLDIYNLIFANENQLHSIVFYEIRIPRMLLALLVGASLALSGAVCQSLFKNPLADPSIIGVSSGAALGASIAIVFFANFLAPFTTSIFAFVFGLLASLIIFSLAKNSKGVAIFIIILAGIAISALAGAFIGFISYFTTNENLRALSTWQMGNLTGATYHNVFFVFLSFLFASIFFFKKAKVLNVLLLGDSQARYLGLNVQKEKLQIIAVVSFLIAICVAVSGIIGFIGLVVPHIIRLLIGADNRKILPLVAMLGAVLLASSDLLARIIFLPAETPVGLITALLGAPFFLLLILTQKHKY